MWWGTRGNPGWLPGFWLRPWGDHSTSGNAGGIYHLWGVWDVRETCRWKYLEGLSVRIWSQGDWSRLESQMWECSVCTHWLVPDARIRHWPGKVHRLRREVDQNHPTEHNLARMAILYWENWEHQKQISPHLFLQVALLVWSNTWNSFYKWNFYLLPCLKDAKNISSWRLAAGM